MSNCWTRLVIVVLLIIAAILSYVDRGNLSVVLPEISAAFHLNDRQLGQLASAFFWSYALFNVVMGWGADRYSPKWLFAWGFFIWTLATLAMGFANGFVMLFCLRLLLGVGESVVYPAISRILLDHFPEEKRGLPNALIAAGTKIGPAISIAIAGPILFRWGWRELFILTGAVSLLWLVPWVVFVPNTHSKKERGLEPDSNVKFGELMTQLPFWGTTIGFFSFGYAVYFLITWLPSYLELDRHFSKEKMLVLGQIPFWVMGGVTVVFGFLGDGLVQRGFSATFSRLTFLVGGLSLCGISLLAVPFTSSDDLCIVWLALACAGLGMFSANAWAITQTLAGEHAAGKWSGVQNAIGNLGGAATSIITGEILQRTHSYNNAFFVAAGILLAGILSYALLVRNVREILWEMAGESFPVSSLKTTASLIGDEGQSSNK